MHAHQYQGATQAPPPYQNNVQINQHLVDYNRPADERMADFEQLVARYESEFKEIFDK
jgi:hypothetical protein